MIRTPSEYPVDEGMDSLQPLWKEPKVEKKGCVRSDVSDGTWVFQGGHPGTKESDVEVRCQPFGCDHNV